LHDILARNPDFTQRCETAIITKGGNLVQHEGKNSSRSTTRVPGATKNSASTNRPLSNRYRWISYNDLPESEGEEEDEDDEEFEVNGRRLAETVKMRGMNFCHIFIGGENQGDGEREGDQGVVDTGKAPNEMKNSMKKVNQLVHRLARLHNEPIMN